MEREALHLLLLVEFCLDLFVDVAQGRRAYIMEICTAVAFR